MGRWVGLLWAGDASCFGAGESGAAKFQQKLAGIFGSDFQRAFIPSFYAHHDDLQGIVYLEGLRNS